MVARPAKEEMEPLPRSPSRLLTLCLPALLSLCLQCLGANPAETAGDSRKLYLVYMGEKQHEDPDLVTALHHDTLSSVLGSKDAALDSIVYSYKHGFSGFAAMLTDSQATQVAGLPGVVSVTRSRPIKAATTRSWDFLGLAFENPPSRLLQKANMGEGIIIGVIDSGVWPESKSFRDEGFGPIPSRWKGTCQHGQLFNASLCNRKLIGARWYSKSIPEGRLEGEYLSPRDANGHGTHTASTAAGSPVRGANFHGLAAGLARGGAPRARVAVYKSLWGKEAAGGNDATVVAAIDDAIHDGVDILSLSLGGKAGSRSSAPESWATLHAVQKGITVVYAAGNDGPAPESIVNASPWAITVAASTTDRSFPTAITLGDNRTIVGQATYYKTKKGADEFNELYYDGSDCGKKTLTNPTLVRGRVALCNMGDAPDKQFVVAEKHVKKAGGVGLIFARYTTNVIPECPDFPCAIVSLESRQQIYEYALRAQQISPPVVKLTPTRTAVSSSFAPRVAAYSSRGPSAVFPALLKPDVAAPGVRILAAVKDSYVFEDGTSMATPHVSGVVALLKSLHPSWSPAAIKSAIVTTANTADKYGLPIVAEGVPRKINADPFDYGGGNINPDGAADPGLVYDINPRDYDEFKCWWDAVQNCKPTLRPMYHLNLPSISIPDLKSTVTVSRTVTNVGAANSTYKAMVQSPPGIGMEVIPSALEFDAITRVQSFEIKFTAIHKMQGVYTFGCLTWEDGAHRVRIPIAVRAIVQELYADVQ